MILNFLFFSCFLIVLSSLGNLFNFHYLELKKTSEPKNFLTVENIISGIFLLGLITVLVNFFLPLDNLVLKFFLTTLFLYSLFFSKKNIFFSIKKNFIFILFISLISFYMQPGYDGGLYHLPHQNFIRDYKIIFGLFNLHERFGLASIYGYISSLFWIKNDLLILTYLQSSFYFLLFIFLKKKIISNQIQDSVIGLSTLLFVPVWIRYIQPSYSLVDFSSAIIFLISFFYGFELFFDKKNFKKNLKFFLLISSILLTFKTSNLIFIIYIFFIIFYFLLKNYLSFKRLLSISVLPLLLLILWVIKTFINTSCLIFPLLSSCFNTEWSDVALVNNIVNEIINYGRAYTSSINISVIINFILSFIEIFNLIFFLIFILLIVFLFYFFKRKNLIKFFVVLLLVTNFSLFILIEPITGFTTLLFSKNEANFILSQKIIYREIFLFVFIILSSIFITLSFSCSEFEFKKKNKNNFFYIPVIFCFFFTAFWLITSPNPRFGVGYFAIIPACLSIFILNFFHIRSKLNYLDKIKYFVIIYCLVSSYILIKKNFKFNDLFVYPQKKIEAVETTKRNSFGVKTIFKCNIHESNFCWLEKNCYFIEKDANLHYLGFNYMLFKKINDRQHPKCK